MPASFIVKIALIVVDILLLLLVRCIFGFLSLFSVNRQLKVVGTTLRLITKVFPDYRHVSLRNLTQAFPELTDTDRELIYQKSFTEIARLIVDFGRMSSLDRAWMEENVIYDEAQFKALKAITPHRPVLYATGHLGSFELMAYAVSLFGYPLHFIVRNFSLPKLDAWWSGIREQHGNRIISRKGAVLQLLQLLAEGKDCALLFDQNVKRNYAIFVPWFNRPAATTFALGLAAVKSKASILAASMKFRHHDGKYEITTTLIECQDVHDDQTLSQDQKVLEITARASREFERHIRAFPEGWFWMHRRWKTQPEGLTESFYAK